MKRSAPLFLCLLVLLVSATQAKDKQWGAGISANVARPYEQVVPILREIANDGLIRGSSQFKGVDNLDGAISGKGAGAFPAWKGRGTVFYKELPDTLAPTHFRDSNDRGTVVVRYIVEPVTENSSRVTIEAVFLEDSHHGSHESDGNVETSEFVAISEKFRMLDEAEKQKEQEAADAERHKHITDLQESEAREQAQLESVRNEVNSLQQKVAELERGRRFRVRTVADLKAEPFNQAQVVRSLQPGESVVVLLETRSWYRVQTGNGENGWIYRLMLEVAQ